MEADEKVKLARAGIPVTASAAYLDTGSVGPISKTYAETLAACTDEDLGTGRALTRRFEGIERARARLTGEIAALLGTQPERIGLTQGTTDGIRTLLRAYPWQAGDEIVSTRVEYPACADALRDIPFTHGVTCRFADVPETDAGDLGWLERCVTPRTRLIALSGVAYTTGQRLPLGAICRFAAARGIKTLVDGAQLAGARRLDLGETPVDFLALPLQKWLCGPEGLGALYARAGAIDPQPPARSVHGWPVLEAAAEHLAWLAGTFGWPWIHRRTEQLSEYARKALQDADAVRLITPSAHAGLLSVQTRPGESGRIAGRLGKSGLVVRHRPELDLLRLSTAFFTTENEIDRAIETFQYFE